MRLAHVQPPLLPVVFVHHAGAADNLPLLSAARSQEIGASRQRYDQ